MAVRGLTEPAGRGRNDPRDPVDRNDGDESERARLGAPTRLGATLFLLLIPACASEARERSFAEVRDSAGVEIVENRSAAAAPRPEWRLREVARIGTVDGPEATNFGSVADLAWLSTGELLVLDRQAASVRVFAADGTYLRTIGGPGEGPGELGPFTYSVLVAPGDSVAVPDRSQGRFTVYARNGDVARVVALDGSIPTMRWALRPDGHLVARSLQNSMEDDGTFRSWDGLLRVGPDGTPLDTLLEVPSSANIRMTASGMSAPLLLVGPIWTVLRDGRLAATRTDLAELAFVGDGGTERIVRHADWERRAISDAEADRMRAMFLERYEEAGIESSEAVRRFPSHTGLDRFPAFTQLLPDSTGGVWVRRMGRSLDEIDPTYLNAAFFERLGSTRWDVLDADGVHVATLCTPDKVDLFGAATNRVAGIHRDELGVQTVRIYEVDRGRDDTR